MWGEMHDGEHIVSQKNSLNRRARQMPTVFTYACTTWSDITIQAASVQTEENFSCTGMHRFPHDFAEITLAQFCCCS